MSVSPRTFTFKSIISPVALNWPQELSQVFFPRLCYRTRPLVSSGGSVHVWDLLCTKEADTVHGARTGHCIACKPSLSVCIWDTSSCWLCSPDDLLNKSRHEGCSAGHMTAYLWHIIFMTRGWRWKMHYLIMIIPDYCYFFSCNRQTWINDGDLL